MSKAVTETNWPLLIGGLLIGSGFFMFAASMAMHAGVYLHLATNPDITESDYWLGFLPSMMVDLVAYVLLGVGSIVAALGIARRKP